jgi:hypothetical protein
VSGRTLYVVIDDLYKRTPRMEMSPYPPSSPPLWLPRRMTSCSSYFHSYSAVPALSTPTSYRVSCYLVPNREVKEEYETLVPRHIRANNGGDIMIRELVP